MNQRPNGEAEKEESNDQLGLVNLNEHRCNGEIASHHLYFFSWSGSILTETGQTMNDVIKRYISDLLTIYSLCTHNELSSTVLYVCSYCT
jgi:hypothetical protein